MTISTINRKVDELGHSWEEFKKLNDRRLAEIERKGTADSLTLEHISKINDVLDAHKSKLDNIETAFNRPSFGGEYNEKATSENMTRKIFETSPLRQLASVATISSDSLEIIEDNDEAGAAWGASETAAVTESTSPQIGKITIDAYELVAQPKATQKLIDDASVDIEAWLTQKLTEVFSRRENTAFITGDGSAKPKGILAYVAGTGANQIEQLNSGTSAVVTADSLVRLFYALKDEYARNATFLMNRSTAQAVRLLKDTTNQYIWNPGLAMGTPNTLMGVPVTLASNMPVPAASSLSVAVGDFRRAYQIVDRTGVRILRDPYTEKPFVKFYSTKRVGGQVINFEALKILKLSV